jgi:hypothetical protein
MLFNFKTWASADQAARATWYILKRADCPDAGSAGFSGSFLAAGWGCDSEQLTSRNEEMHNVRKKSFFIITWEHFNNPRAEFGRLA